MYDIRLRRYSDSGTAKGLVLPTLDISDTDAESATGRLTFTTTAKTAGRLVAPFVVGLEENTGESFWTRPRNDLFIVLEDAEDAADQSDVMQFTAQSYVGWLLSKALHWWTPQSADGRTRYIHDSPGQVLNTWLNEAKVNTAGLSRGWAPSLTWDFTSTKDSLGQSWTSDDLIDGTFELWRPYSSFIQAWVDQGRFEWWAEGMKLRLARVGSGIDRTSTVVLGGPAFSGAPAKTNFADVFSTVVLLPEKATATHRFNPGADTRFGALETSMSLSGVDNWATAEKQAQPAMTENRAKKAELSFDWSPSAGGPVPGRDFDIGDLVTARRKSGKQPLRVIGIQRSKRAGEPATVRAIVGDKLVGLQAKIANRVGTIAQGTIIGGSGTSMPSNPGPAPLIPATPSALRVQSNTASWRADGSAATSVVLAWDAVTTDGNGNRLDCDLYEIDSRTAAGAPQSQTTTAALSATVTTWEPGTGRYVRVRVRSVAGAWSPWSGEIAVVPATPTSIIPKAPTGLVVASNTAAFQADGSALATIVVTWAPVTQATDNTAVSIAEYEVTMGADKVRTTSPTATFFIPTGKSVDVTVRALTTLKVWGDPSATLNVGGANPTVSAAVPTTPALTAGMGGIAVVWDGRFAGNTLPPAGWAATLIEVATASGGPWSSLGAPLTAAGGSTIPVPAGSARWVRFVALDTLARRGGVSASATATATGVPLGQLDQAVQDAIGKAQTTADGKNRIYAQTAQPAPTPPAALTAGDQWWVLDALGASIVGVKVWNGSAWVPYLLTAEQIIAAGSITSPLIKAASILVDHIGPNVGSVLNLTGNDAIVQIGGQLADHSADLALKAQQVATAQAAADAAGQAAADAQGGANGAIVQASAAQQVAQATAQALTAHQSIFQVTSDGGRFVTPDGSQALVLTPAGVAIQQNGIAQTTWTAGAMVVPNALLDGATIGSVRFEKSGTRTLVRQV